MTTSSKDRDTADVLVPQVDLGTTGIRTSALAIGAWGFGDASAPEARVSSTDELVELLQESFRSGIRFIDSADAYDNESRLGELLRHVDVPDDLTISTKYGHGREFTADAIYASAERSLAAYDVEVLDIMMVHDPRTEADMNVILGAGGALEGLRRLQDEGLVRCTGVATGTMRPLQIAVESGEFDCIQFPRLYTLLNREAVNTGLLNRAREAGMATLNAAPFGGNILATGATPSALYGYAPALPEVREAVRQMEERCRVHGIALPTAALSYSLTEPLIDLTIVGVTTTQELRWNLEACRTSVPRSALEEIARIGAVDPTLIGGPEFISAWPADRMPDVPFGTTIR